MSTAKSCFTFMVNVVTGIFPGFTSYFVIIIIIFLGGGGGGFFMSIGLLVKHGSVSRQIECFSREKTGGN